MKIVVCGDSFASADRHRPETHFSEILCKYGNEVVNLARGGISNVGIAFQIQAAIKLNPDAIIFTTTSHDRIDMIIDDRKFIPNLGLKNFIYPYQSDASTGSKHVGNTNAAILSDVVEAFLQPRPDQPAELNDPARAEIVKHYLVYFHDVAFKKIQNDWIIGYWKYLLEEHSIPYLHVHQGGSVAQQMYEYVKQHPTLINQTVYHTDAETQIKVAEELNNVLKELVK